MVGYQMLQLIDRLLNLFLARQVDNKKVQDIFL